MSNIKSQDFLRDLYKYVVKQENQGVFVIKFFTAAGSKNFALPKSKTYRSTKALENERHYIKDRSVLTTKDKFPNPIDATGLENYLVSELKDDTLRACMSHFAIPVSCPEDKRKLAKALTEQFQSFLNADVEDISNGIPTEYEHLINGSGSSADVRQGTAYAGDDFWVENQPQHKASCYGTVTHTWVIHNSGSVLWQGRKLVLREIEKNNPRPTQTEIAIPDVDPNKYTKIAADFETRSIEGVFTCKWVMQDSKGTDCFRFNSPFNVVIDVSYRADMEE